MDGLRRKPEAWAEQLETVISDPDGWRGRYEKSWDEPITKVEFLARCQRSSIKMSKTLGDHYASYGNSVMCWWAGYEAGREVAIKRMQAKDRDG